MPTLQNYLANSNNLPVLIGNYSLTGTKNLEDGSLQIYYISKD
jgi:hypothetical protein